MSDWSISYVLISSATVEALVFEGNYMSGTALARTRQPDLEVGRGWISESKNLRGKFNRNTRWSGCLLLGRIAAIVSVESAEGADAFPAHEPRKQLGVGLHEVNIDKAVEYVTEIFVDIKSEKSTA